MSEDLSYECQRCGKRIGPDICHVSVVGMEEKGKSAEFSHGAWWICADCWGEIDGFMSGKGGEA